MSGRFIQEPRDPEDEIYAYSFRSYHEKIADVRKWCRQQFGQMGDGERWYLLDHLQYWLLLFRDANDAFAFRMRWC